MPYHLTHDRIFSNSNKKVFRPQITQLKYTPKIANTISLYSKVHNLCVKLYIVFIRSTPTYVPLEMIFVLFPTNVDSHYRNCPVPCTISWQNFCSTLRQEISIMSGGITSKPYIIVPKNNVVYAIKSVIKRHKIVPKKFM